MEYVALLYLVRVGLQDLEQLSGGLILLRSEDLMLQLLEWKTVIMVHLAVKMAHLMELKVLYQMALERELQSEIVALVDELQAGQMLVLGQVYAMG